MGRYTNIHSDGYIDRASSNLHSYNFSALFQEKNTELSFWHLEEKKKRIRRGMALIKQLGKLTRSSIIPEQSMMQIGKILSGFMTMKLIITDKIITSYYGTKNF
jgi:hypothetical protein